MIDAVCEEEIKELKEFLTLWNAFSNLATEARGDGKNGEAAEKRFSEAREEIARRYPPIMDRLEVSRGDQDEVVYLLGRMTSLNFARRMPDIQWKKIEEVQSRIGVGLQGLLGLLESRKRSLVKVRGYNIVLRKIISSWVLKLIYITVGIIVFFLVLERVV